MLEARPPDERRTTARCRPTARRERAAREAKKPVCIVLHQEHSNPGHVGQWFVPQRLRARHPQAALRRCPARDAGGSLRRRRLRRTDERQRQGRVHPPRDGVDRGRAARRRSPISASASARRCSPTISAPRSASTPRRWSRSAITRSSPQSMACASAPFPSTSTSGIARAASWPRGARLLATSDGAYPSQAFAYGSGDRRAVPPRDHLRPGAPLDRPQHRAPRHERRPRAARAHRRATSCTRPRCTPGSTASLTAG